MFGGLWGVLGVNSVGLRALNVFFLKNVLTRAQNAYFAERNIEKMHFSLKMGQNGPIWCFGGVGVLGVVWGD